MTAEIAILNKTAVALAADSAVTISAGSKEEKIFDSADKLFELCINNPIGIMIYNNTSFSETPLSTLICQFRNQCNGFERVQDAAFAFLSFLDDFGRASPQVVEDNNLRTIVTPLVSSIYDRFFLNFEKKVLSAEKPPQDFRAASKEILDDAIGAYQRVIKRRRPALFIGTGPVTFTKRQEDIIRSIIDSKLPMASDEQRLSVKSLCKSALKSDLLSSNRTGIVIAGFGSSELFPTLCSFEIDGIVCGHLKHKKTNHVDIDRAGVKARVLPFAQKEMVERFLYGLDEATQTHITNFCKKAVTEIGDTLLSALDTDTDSEKEFKERAKDAEKVFVDKIRDHAFQVLRSQSRDEIEDMVEFMPKPELAKMAEALVNLTSIKRRVSRGLETVAGPIDVALISQSEGFIWIKRKHYFPKELNWRYFKRINGALNPKEGSDHGEDEGA